MGISTASETSHGTMEMTTTIRLTEQTEYLLESLTWKVRGLTIEQFERIHRAKFDSLSGLRRDLDRLERADLVRSTATALVLLEPVAPLQSWRPGEGPIDAPEICWELERRWRSARARRTKVYWATELAAHQFGGVADFAKHPSQIEHDLGTAAVLARLHELRPAAAVAWTGEMILRRDYVSRVAWLKKIPDAAIISDGHVTEFVEFGGQYSAGQLRRFHQHCRRFAIPYTVW